MSTSVICQHQELSQAFSGDEDNLETILSETSPAVRLRYKLVTWLLELSPISLDFWTYFFPPFTGRCYVADQHLRYRIDVPCDKLVKRLEMLSWSCLQHMWTRLTLYRSEQNTMGTLFRVFLPQRTTLKQYPWRRNQGTHQTVFQILKRFVPSIRICLLLLIF